MAGFYEARTLLSSTELRFEYDGNGRQIYMGEGQPGATNSDKKWRIKKFQYNSMGQQDAGALADGRAEFVFSWDDRATYTYNFS